MDLCESEYQGYWLAPDDVGFNNNNNVLQVAIACENYNDADKDPVASYNQTLDQCDFTDTWFEAKCSLLGGYFENSVCYTPPITNN